MSYSLVSIDEWVILNYGMTKRGGLLIQSRIKIAASESHMRLGDGGFQSIKIPQTCRPATLSDDTSVKFKHFTQIDVTHQLNLLYRFRFFFRTRSEANSKSGSEFKRSHRAALASFSIGTFRRLAVACRRSISFFDKSTDRFKFHLQSKSNKSGQALTSELIMARRHVESSARLWSTRCSRYRRNTSRTAHLCPNLLWSQGPRSGEVS